MIVLSEPLFNQRDSRMWGQMSYADGTLEELHQFAQENGIDSKFFDPNWKCIVLYNGHKAKKDKFTLDGAYWITSYQYDHLQQAGGVATLKKNIIYAHPLLFKWYQEHVRPRPLVPYRTPDEQRTDEELLALSKANHEAWLASPEHKALSDSFDRYIAARKVARKLEQSEG